MARIHSTLRLLLLLLTATTTAIPTSSNLLISAEGNDSCPSDQKQCGPSLPDNFCCPSDYKCMSLAGNTTAVCCPSGSDCAKISPITCNVSQQDPKKNPKAPVKTTVFDVDLEECGQGCCPFGYSCFEGKECRLNDDQEESPSEDGNDDDDDASSTTKTTTGGSTSTGRPTGSLTETELPIITGNPDDEDSESDNNTEDENADGAQEKDSGPDLTTIIGGIVGGVAALLALAVIIFVCARRRAKRDPNKPSSSSSSSSSPSSRPNTSQTSRAHPPVLGLNISDPIAEQNSYRTDFARKAAATNTNSISSLTSEERREMSTAPATGQRHNSVHPRISTVSLNNPFQEPSPTSPLSSQRYSGGAATTTEYNVTNGRVVGGKLAPIRGMKPSSSSSSYGRTLTPPGARRESDDDGRSINIDVFADPVTVEGRRRQNSTMTTFSGMMAQMGERGKGTPPPPATLRPGNFV